MSKIKTIRVDLRAHDVTALVYARAELRAFIYKERRRLWIALWLSLALNMVLAYACLAGEPYQAAIRRDLAKLPASQRPYAVYLSTHAAASTNAKAGEGRRALAKVTAFMIASTSRAVVLERQMPVAVATGREGRREGGKEAGGELLRIDLRGLRWSVDDWQHVLKRYPYSPPLPLSPSLPPAIRADWLVVELADAHASDSYYRLLYGAKNMPATRDEFLKAWRVDGEKSSRFGWIETRSGVSKQRTRWLENRPVGRGYVWGTRDVVELREGKDPLEAPDGAFAHDAEEWIVGIPKISIRTGQRGALQVYLLANAKGQRIDRAPVDIVEDYTKFRGLAEIRTPGSCIQCHAEGIKPPTQNGLRSLIEGGVDVYANRTLQEALERFHLTDVGKEISRNQEDYATAVEAVSGEQPAELVKHFAAVVRFYDLPLSLAQAALELHTKPANLKAALAAASSDGVKLGARLAGLAHGRTMPRVSWERDGWRRASLAVRNWDGRMGDSTQRREGAK